MTQASYTQPVAALDRAQADAREAQRELDEALRKSAGGIYAREVFTGTIAADYTVGLPKVTLDTGFTVTAVSMGYNAQAGDSVQVVRLSTGGYHVAAKARTTPDFPGWVDLVLQNSWSWYDTVDVGWAGQPIMAQYHRPQLTKTASGYVELAGCIKGGSVVAGSVIANLPVWARPSVDMRFVVAGAGSTNYAIDVLTTGDVVNVNASVNTMLFLDGIAFTADTSLVWTTLASIGFAGGWADSATAGDPPGAVTVDTAGRVWTRGVLRRASGTATGAMTAAFPVAMRISTGGTEIHRGLARGVPSFYRFDFGTAGAMLDQTGYTTAVTRMDINACYLGPLAAKWITASYVSGSDYGSGYETRGWQKASDGVVHLRGLCNFTAGGRVFEYLPVGYRPAGIRVFSTIGNGVSSRHIVFPDGTVYWSTGTSWQSMGDIRFVAEQ